SYTSVAPSGEGISLGGIARSVNGSTAAAHAATADVLFVDGVMRDSDSSLISIDSKSLDLNRLYNAIVINHADGTYRVDDATSIASNSERVLTINAAFFNRLTEDWFSLLASDYLARLKDYHNIASLRVPYSPLIELGQLLVVDTSLGLKTDYDTFEVMRVTDDLQNYQTTLILREY
ncbi:MAG: hypothetical protein OXI63_11575, partial [Candidatus Poribacteria bacterium]|nr:hypothetical protein [Candidatus Poribacteria bacterium]